MLRLLLDVFLFITKKSQSLFSVRVTKLQTEIQAVQMPDSSRINSFIWTQTSGQKAYQGMSHRLP